MTRKPTDTRLPTELLRPQAEPVDTFVQPGPSPLRGVAEALAKIDKPLKQFLDARAKKQAEEDLIRGEAAFYNDNAEDIADGVRTGKVPAHYSPNFVKGFKAAQGNVAGNQLRSDFRAAYDAWDGKNSEDPEAYDNFVEEFLRGRLGSNDPDVLRGVMPHVRQLVEDGRARYETYRSERVTQGSLDAHVAGANQDIDELNREGLSTEEGTNYPVVFQKIEEKRAAYVATGGNPADFDKTMMDAMSAKILATRDPGLLAWFDQKVPGTDYTYGDSPYGQKVKADTITSLEVISRRQTAEEAAAQTAKDKAQEDAAHRAAIDFLIANPSAPLPDGILKQGEVDPTFKVRIEEWRKALHSGFTDEKKLQAVYGKILAGGGYKAVQRAFAQGVFGRTEDLTAAYAFAKSFEDNKDRISGVTSSATFERFLKDIDIRTKGFSTETYEPMSGTSNEGYEAQYDFRRLVTDWMVLNPDASQIEIEKAVNTIGKTIMDRFVLNEEAEGVTDAHTYERAADMGFDNPFTEGTAPAPTEQQAPEQAPTEGEAEEQRGEVEDIFNGMTADQRRAVEERAKALNLSPQEFLDKFTKREPAAENDKPEPWIDTPNFKIGPYVGPGSKWWGRTQSEVPAEQRGEMTTPDGTPVQQASARTTPVMTAQIAEGFIDQAMAEAVDVVEETDNYRPTGQTETLLKLIRKHEAGGNFNAVYGRAGSKQDLAKLTLNDILARQAAARRRGVASTAIGGYQFIYKTLRSLKGELGLTGNEKFTRKLQDRLAVQLLKRRGWDAFRAGRISKKQFALRLSQEWASLPNPSTGRSYYAGDGLNASSARVRDVYAALGLA